MIMQALIENVAVLLIFGLIGWLLGTFHILSSQNLKLLSVLEVWLFLPSNYLLNFSKNFTIAYISEKYTLLIVSVLVLSSLVAINAFVIPRVVRNDPYRQHVLRYALTVANYGYMGYPLIQGVYGDLMLLNAQVFSLPMAMYTSTEGYRMLTNTGKISLKKLINPMIVSILIGCVLGLTGWKLPSVLQSVISKSSACMGPVSMLLAGITISDYPLRLNLRDKQAYVVSFLRLLVIPIALCLVLSTFLPKEIVLVVVLMYAMPCGLNTIIYPRMIGEDCRPGAAMAMISTVASLATIPICIQVLELMFR